MGSKGLRLLMELKFAAGYKSFAHVEAFTWWKNKMQMR